MSSPDAPDGSSAGMPAAGSSSQLDTDDLMLGQEIGRYRIVRKLGEGGMGEVYAAEHLHINKQVAIKLLRSEIVSNKEAVDRFRQEARSASSIGHKNIIQIDDFGEMPDGRIFLFMELLDGMPLNDMLREETLSPDRILNILIQTGHGLAAAHKKGIVHRDMKPENIFVTHDDTGQDVPKLLDFGIAKVSGSDGDHNLTRTGTIFGTPFYMAPEQALGQGVDGRADVYAMGVIMYEIFTGSVPFQGESFMGILTQHITAEPMPPSQRAAQAGRTLPPGVEEVIARCMEKEPDARYQTMDELVQALVGLYRRYAGAGMSGYMQAHMPPPSSMMAAVSYTGPHGLPSSTPVPMHGMGVGQSQPFPSHGPGVSYPYPDGSSMQLPTSGSKAGLIAALVILLAVVGGVVGFIVLSEDKGGGGVAQADAGAPQADAGRVVAAADARVVVPNPADAAVVAVADAGAANPPVDTVKVALRSNPPGALIYDGNGDPVGTTPYVLQVVPGVKARYTLKRDRHKDAEVVIDGSKKEVVAKLVRERRGNGRNGNGRNGDTQKDAGAGSLGIPLE